LRKPLESRRKQRIDVGTQQLVESTRNIKGAVPPLRRAGPKRRPIRLAARTPSRERRAAEAPLSVLDVAVEVLRTSRRPLTIREIIDRAQAAGLLRSNGKTPHATLSAQLYRRVRQPGSPVERIAEPGQSRARRGTVRW